RTALHYGFGDGKRWFATYTPTNVLTLGAWNHVAATYDGSFHRIYVNGELVHSNQFTALPSSPVGWIGRVNSFFRGRIADIRLWQTGGSQSETRSTLFPRLSGHESGLAAVWHLDDATDAAAPTELRSLSPLADRQVTALYLDRSGAMWIGSADGLRRYTF